MSRYGIFRGRFQPFHLGHLEQCRRIARLHPVLVIAVAIVKRDIKLEEVATWVERSVAEEIVESFRSINNPYSFLEAQEMITEALLEDGLERSRFYVVPHFPPLVFPEKLELLTMPPKDLSVLYVPPKGIHNIAAPKIYSERGWRVRVPAIAREHSGTEIRKIIETHGALRDLVPPSVERYLDQLRASRGGPNSNK